MSGTRIEPFAEAHLPGAALLAARHAGHRKAEPLLVEGDELAALRSAWAKPVASGAVAMRGEKVEAYVLADVASDPLFGRRAWVSHAGQAASDGERLRDAYAAAAEAWAAAGAERHYVLVPAMHEALAPWYR